MVGHVLGHYRIDAKIGAGGMGEVYRAHDLHLERDVALKVLPEGFLADEAAGRRFRREALALSKLNHPNIATVFDFDAHEGVHFLSMELIHGEPLADRLRAGALPETEILRLGRQLAEGLAAAHAQGVIHRDVKPGNVLITSEGRLKILDFGLAIVGPSDGDLQATHSATSATSIAGTLPYMSPEQLRGRTVDARSDVYSAGVVLYEMMTGRRPFPQSQSAELIGAILHQPPSSTHAPTSGAISGLNSVVMKALEKEPGLRYQSARELLIALESTGLAHGSAAAPPQRHWRVRTVGAVALAAVVLIGATIALNVGGLRDRVLSREGSAGSAAPVAGAPVHVRRSVAVLGFKSLSGRPADAWLSTALSEMLTTELAAGERLRMIPGENVSQTKINLSLTDADSYGKETLSAIKRNLGADMVVLGSYLVMEGGQIRLDLRLQDAVAGETLAAISEKGTEARIDDLVNRSGSRLRERLGAGEVSAADAVSVKATLPSNAEAARLYAAGLDRLRVFDALSARELLERALAADSGNALTHSALAAAWSSLGYDERAKAESSRAFELSAGLSREDRLAVEGRTREAAREWDKAIDVYRTLSGFFPDNLDYGLLLASAQTSAGKARDALTTVEALRRVPTVGSADPRIDLAEASAASSLSDYKRQLVVSETAATKSAAQGARLLLARARSLQASAHSSLGEFAKAAIRYQEAQEIFAAAGDRAGVARALAGLGNGFIRGGEYSKVDQVFTQALAIQREIGDKRGLATSLNSLSVANYDRGDMPKARALIEESLAIQREIKSRGGTARALNNLGIVLFAQKDYAAATQVHQEALAIRREIGDQQGVASSLGNLAEVFRGHDDLAGSRRNYEEALAIEKQIGDSSGVGFTLTALGDVILDQGDLPLAREQFEEALRVLYQTGEKRQAAITRNSLARVLIEQGQPDRAEVMAREAAQEFQAEKVADSEGAARVRLAEAESAQGHVREAQVTIDAAAKLLSARENLETRLMLVPVAARIRAASGALADATRSLEGIVAEAARSQAGSTAFEARLVLGELELKSGKTASGASRLTALEKEATAKGFMLVARKAHR